MEGRTFPTNHSVMSVMRDGDFYLQREVIMFSEMRVLKSASEARTIPISAL